MTHNHAFAAAFYCAHDIAAVVFEIESEFDQRVIRILHTRPPALEDRPRNPRRRTQDLLAEVQARHVGPSGEEGGQLFEYCFEAVELRIEPVFFGEPAEQMRTDRGAGYAV